MTHGSTLYTLGLSYYAHGTVKQGRKVQAYFYKLCNPATPEQLAEIRKVFPHVHTGQSQSQYAPELKASVLLFPSKAKLNRNSF
jgi:hypothetical protein